MFSRILMIACMGLSLAGSAQSRRLTAATIETEAGSTAGFVRDPGGNTTPQVFSFATDKAGPFRDIIIADTRRVVLSDGSVFERRRIRAAVLETAPANRRLESYASAARIDGEMFVELLIAGTISLYQYEDTFHYPHFYLVHEGGSLMPLPFEPYIDSLGRYQGEVAYQNTLFRLATSRGCKSAIETDIVLAAYEASPLMRLVQRINRCGGAAGKEFGNSTRLDTRMGFRGSVSHYSQTLSVRESTDKFTAAHKGMTYGLGAFIDVFSRVANPRMIYTIAGYYSSIRYNVNYSLPVYTTYQNIARATSDARLNFIALEPSARYQLRTEGIRLFVEAGAGFRLLISGRSRLRYYDSNDVPSYIFEDMSREARFRYDVLAGAGLQLNRGSVHLRYSHGLRQNTMNAVSLVLHLRIN
ncbi:MAG: hypothetical protein EOO16_04050 [Chitinophagaceae bacterium]|nr:MAG: hypothetical protein EOO16_04050 [Chitinophagaceae bacterium]